MIYAFELGRKKELCFNELLSVLGKKKLIKCSLDTATFSLDLPFPQDLQDRLGGTIKIIEIFKETDLNGLQKSIQDQLETEFQDHEGKIPFAISLLNFKNLREINIKELLNFSKKILKSLGSNCRFVNKDFRSNPQSSTIYKARIIEKGIDLNIIKEDEKILIGKTIAIQDIDSYSIRDYEKPYRDAFVGMMPPKLAQIMINLAIGNKSQPSSEESLTIYDPFCGTGTIPMEGLLMGMNVIGSDISPKMVDYSNKNCEWLNTEFQIKSSFKIFEKDAKLINKKLFPEQIDAIVTEGHLGPPLSRPPSTEEQKRYFREMAILHSAWLKTAHLILAKTSKVVMCLPAYNTRNGIIHFKDFDRLAGAAGFKIENMFTYDRPDQMVLRDVMVLEKL